MSGFASSWWKGYCVKKLEEVLETPDSKKLLDGSHILLTFTVGGAVLISQLLLQTWPSTFSGMLILSPVIAVGLLGLLATTAWPACNPHLPMMMGGSCAALTAWTAVFGAVFHLMPFADNRATFTLLNTIALTVGVYFMSRRVVPSKMKELMFNAAGGHAKAPEEKEA